MKFDGEIVTKEYSFDAFNRLYFFYDRDPLTDFSKHTVIKGSTPYLKIVDSDENKVVIKGNKDCLDKIKIDVKYDPQNEYYRDNGSYYALTITFSDDCYVPVHVDDNSYDYDEGMYVYFDELEVTVYANIYSLLTDSKIELDYSSSKCDHQYIEFSSDATEAIIRNIDTDIFEMDCSGNSNIQLSGNANEVAKLSLMHNSHIDANNLKAKKTNFSVYASLFHFSYIKYDNRLIFRTCLISLLQGV